MHGFHTTCIYNIFEIMLWKWKSLPLTRVGGKIFQIMDGFTGFSHFELMWMKTCLGSLMALAWQAQPIKLEFKKMFQTKLLAKQPQLFRLPRQECLRQLKVQGLYTQDVITYINTFQTRVSDAPLTRISDTISINQKLCFIKCLILFSFNISGLLFILL